MRAVQETHTCFRDIRRYFQEDVVDSHGNHVPRKVRDYSTMLFWMPRILQEPELTSSSAFWKGAKPYLGCVSAWVANQVDAFEWPDTEQLFEQYVALMCVWWKLSRNADTAARLWAPRHDHSRDAWKAARPVFCWKAWWQITHTDRRFCPKGLEGAFAVYHFVGSFGVSEALAESICSTLGSTCNKRCPRLSLQRTVEKTLLRRGSTAFVGNDDLFILRAWAEYFGGLQPDRFRVVFKSRRKRAARFPLGGGSQVIHQQLKQPGGKCDSAELRRLPRLAKLGQNGRRWGASKWCRFLKR